MSYHGTNPNFNAYTREPDPRYRFLSTMTRDPSADVEVLNPNDKPISRHLVAYESGLLNPNQDNPVMLGQSYYTIGLGYGFDPKDRYVTRSCSGIVPRKERGSLPRINPLKPAATNIAPSGF
jgi:hypothetical protein